MSSNKRNLFDDNSDEEDVSLSINKDYAQRYQEWREAEIKQTLINKYGDADEELTSSSSEDEDDSENLKKVLNKDFFEAIAILKKKDPKIYNKEFEFFKNEKASSDFDPVIKKKAEKEKDKPVFLRDYERKLITERGGQFSDEESDSEEKIQRAESPTYVEEQRQLKDSFKKALQDGDSDDEGDLLKKKEKTMEEKEKEEEDYIEWLKGERAAVGDKEIESKLKPLQNVWNDPKLDEEEKFLRDYILNKKYLEEGDKLQGNVSDDDYEDEYMNQFERKYNFRFEEPDKDFLKRYPRTMENSLRKKDTRRKEHRDAVKQRKEEGKNRKKEELKLLKSLKRKEIMDKIEKIKKITGNDELGLNAEELEEDFDPEAHDRKMRELFNDDYYGGADDAEDEDGLNLPPLQEELGDDDDFTNWDEWDGTEKETGTVEEEIDGGPHCEDADFNMDCDYDPAAEALLRDQKSTGRQSAREKRKLKRQSRFGRLVRQEKPVFDPNDKTFQQYVDEYYGMDYEDLIGDIPCRFKYKSVPANNFGLTIEEILAADDKELNHWASMKKTYAIRPEHVEKNEAKIYAQKALNEELKRKILPSLYRHETENSSKEKKKKKKKKKNNDETYADEEAVDDTFDYGSEERTQGVEDRKEKKKKKKKSVEENNDNEETVHTSCNNISGDEVLEADGASESKTKKKKKQKDDNNEQKESTGATFENGSLDETYEDVDISASKKESNKEKKKKKRMEEKESNGSVSLEKDALEADLSETIDRKKKKKGKPENAPCNSNREINNSGKSDSEIKPSETLKKKRKREDDNQSPGHDNKKAKKNFGHGAKLKKNFKKRNHNQNERNKNETELSDARLKAYGIHPKRFRNRMKYGPQNN